MSRHRTHGDGSRWGSVALGVASGRISPSQNLNRRDFSHGRPKSHQPPRKADIFMEAGRLAAEYLVSKGLLPADSLPGKWPIVAPQPPPIAEGGTSALAQLRNAAPDVHHGRSRFEDEYNRSRRQKYSTGKRKLGPYDRRHDSDWGDWGRSNRTNRPLMDRARGYSDNGGEDDFARRFRRDRRDGFREAGIGVSRVAFDEQPSRSEVTGESGSEQNHRSTDDKASSSSARKDRHPAANVKLDMKVDDSRTLNFEAGGEVKEHASGDLVKKTPSKEILVMQPSGVDDDPLSEHDNDLLKLCIFAKVPTRPRSAIAHTNLKVDGSPKAEASNKFEVASAGASMVVESSLSDPHANQTNNLKWHALDNSGALSVQSMEISVNPRHESCQSPRGMETSRMMIDVREDDSFAHYKTGEIKRESESSLSKVSQENEHSRLHNFRAPQSRPSQNEEMFEAVNQEQQVGDAIFPNCEPEFVVNMEKEKQLEPALFKICDLNLIGSPEIIEIPVDPLLDRQSTSLTLESKKKLSLDFDLSTSNNTNDGDDCNQLPGDNKMGRAINLEDDSLIEDNISGCSKPKNGTIYSSLQNVLNHTPHTAGLSGTQDGCSLEISELLGRNISRCPSLQEDLNNLPNGISLHRTEGFPGDDDPIYLSLGELPISFMEVWDQPPRDYGKFF